MNLYSPLRQKYFLQSVSLLSSGSKDLQMVNINLRVLTRPEASALPTITQMIGTDYDEKVSSRLSVQIMWLYIELCCIVLCIELCCIQIMWLYIELCGTGTAVSNLCFFVTHFGCDGHQLPTTQNVLN